MTNKLLLQIAYSLTHSRRRPLSYRNQSIDLLRKSMDWFLYDNGLRLERVNENSNVFIKYLPPQVIQSIMNKRFLVKL